MGIRKFLQTGLMLAGGSTMLAGFGIETYFESKVKPTTKDVIEYKMNVNKQRFRQNCRKMTKIKPKAQALCDKLTDEYELLDANKEFLERFPDDNMFEVENERHRKNANYGHALFLVGILGFAYGAVSKRYNKN